MASDALSPALRGPTLLRRPLEVGVFLAALVTVAVARAPSTVLDDPDTHWHVRIGRDILASGVLPRVDSYSHTFAGERWIAKEWLAQIVLALVHDAAGPTGLVFLTLACLAGTVAGIFLWLARRFDTRLALVVAVLVLLFLQPQALARPHILAYPLLALWLGGLVDALRAGRTPPLALALLPGLWANLHASAPIALAFAVPLGLEAVLRAAPAARTRTAMTWGAFGLVALLAAFATPYGLGTAGVAAALLNDREATLYIQEWRRMSLDGFGFLALATGLLAAAAVACAPRAAVWRAAIVLLAGIMMVTHVRFMGHFAVAAAIVLADPVAERFAALRAAGGPEARGFGRLGGVALAVLLAALVAITASRPAPGAAITPERALAAAREAGLARPVLNDYNFGGFLLARGVPTFIDGRTDQLFVGGFMHALERALSEQQPDALLAILARHDVTWALVETDGSAARLLRRSPGWRVIHEDPVATVLAREG
ncbi:MAG TPA: hypothetical protein VEA41_13760 [Salinarimonas sp.]|nr:hypothetical protein [Salinarimonas sp.]